MGKTPKIKFVDQNQGHGNSKLLGEDVYINRDLKSLMPMTAQQDKAKQLEDKPTSRKVYVLAAYPRHMEAGAEEPPITYLND